MNTQEKYKKYVNTSFLKALEPVVVERGQGSKYIDPQGREYLDAFSGISVVNSGHGNREVVEAAKAQLDKLLHCCSYVYYSIPMADLAEKLAQITPGALQKTFFGNGGAEAVEGALRLAKQYTGKFEFIALTHSFHGRSLATLSITGNAMRKKGGGPYMPGVAFAPAPYHYRSPYGQKDPKMTARLCARAVEEVILCHTSNRVAAFIIEPVMGEGGIIVPPPEYFEELLPILKKHGIILISDEVQSGFCRTGKMFASEHYGLEPEIMTMAKGIANGLPLSGFIAVEAVADSFTPGDHLSTFGGNPVSCAAALANIAFMEREKLADQAAAKGERVMDKLRGLKSPKVIIGEVRGKGLMIGVELVKNAETKEPASAEAAAIRKLAVEKRVLFGLGGFHGNVLRIQPPLTISGSELDQVVGVVGECMNEI
ncbi:MAG: aminotransferase [Candidatus Glassbacteria bacterium RIFCSPLOWO2_12_FULL_58_11]|uniref:alanine--glyoxylate transaminase n=1 Tax=Candidatus Glassbacteria bacterium RIFCSPLOWO2_12_FULL_58_11 TaxID=1817867 RepID=A0A1F5YPS2_9BACT|nr:MAG: aminotransferase [Candidatus Glassbacteria bacterium RIFCSPLOWO2_12_FULL_58_11]